MGRNRPRLSTPGSSGLIPETGRSSRFLRPLLRPLLFLIPAGFLGLLFLYPLGSILAVSLFPGGDFDYGAFADILRRPALRGAAWFTLWQAVLSTLLTLAAAMPAAYVFARYDFPGKSLARAAITVPFVLPTVVVGSAFLALLGPSGALPLDLSRSVWAILAAHVFYNYAVVVRTVGGLWAHLDPRAEEAARVLGAGRLRTLWEVTLPRLRPAIAAAAAIVFLFTFTSFGVIIILGGLRYATIEVEIYRQTVSYLNLSVAAALAVLQLAAVSLILLLYARYQERGIRQQHLRPAEQNSRRPRGPREWGFVAANLGFAAVFLGGPLLVLIERSVNTAEGYALTYYRSLGETGGTTLFVPPGEALRNSLLFGVSAMLVAVLIGVMAAVVVSYRRGPLARGFDMLLMLPLGTSAVTIGFGFLVAFDYPVDLRTSPVLIPLAHSLVAIPFVVRTTAPVMRSIRAPLRESAAMLGATPARVWREIDLPLVTRSALVGAAFALAISLGEFGATAFIVRPDTPTLPIAIFRLLGQPGSLNFGRAMAMSTVLMVVTAGAILLVERFRVGNTGEF